MGSELRPLNHIIFQKQESISLFIISVITLLNEKVQYCFVTKKSYSNDTYNCKETQMIENKFHFYSEHSGSININKSRNLSQALFQLCYATLLIQFSFCILIYIHCFNEYSIKERMPFCHCLNYLISYQEPILLNMILWNHIFHIFVIFF